VKRIQAWACRAPLQLAWHTSCNRNGTARQLSNDLLATVYEDIP
jgi:hypothetical protein